MEHPQTRWSAGMKAVGKELAKREHLKGPEKYKGLLDHLKKGMLEASGAKEVKEEIISEDNKRGGKLKLIKLIAEGEKGKETEIIMHKLPQEFALELPDKHEDLKRSLKDTAEFLDAETIPAHLMIDWNEKGEKIFHTRDIKNMHQALIDAKPEEIKEYGRRIGSSAGLADASGKMHGYLKLDNMLEDGTQIDIGDTHHKKPSIEDLVTSIGIHPRFDARDAYNEEKKKVWEKELGALTKGIEEGYKAAFPKAEERHLEDIRHLKEVLEAEAEEYRS